LIRRSPKGISPKCIDLTGGRFGRLIPQWPVARVIGSTIWLCLCECGNLRRVSIQKLRSGNTLSCGCYRKSFRLKHGANCTRPDGKRRSTVEYQTWDSMIQRCTNPRFKQWKDYGGRGIKVCDRWRNSFSLFLTDMGLRPSLQHSIDRWPDNDGDYRPGNCRWATRKEQMANTRKSKCVKSA
jgi:hypothetical protein